MFRVILLRSAVIFSSVISGSIAFAQVPCYSAAQCAQFRLQAEQQQAYQQAAQAAALEESARQQRHQVAIVAQARREAEAERIHQDAIRQVAYEEQQRRQAQYQADADARMQETAALRARQAATQQAAYDQQQRQVAIEAENRAAAQLAAENSPDNRCHDPKTAGKLLEYINGLQAASDFNSRAVDIDHLTTLKFDAEHQVISCHGAFILQDGRQMIGTLSTRLNVAGNLLSTFHVD
jgi:hypothetical protein